MSEEVIRRADGTPIGIAVNPERGRWAAETFARGLGLVTKEDALPARSASVGAAKPRESGVIR
jgi:hypothetical protein